MSPKMLERWRAAVQWAVGVVGVSDWDTRFAAKEAEKGSRPYAEVDIDVDFRQATFTLFMRPRTQLPDEKLRMLAVHEAEHVWRYEQDEREADHVAEVARRARMIEP